MDAGFIKQAAGICPVQPQAGLAFADRQFEIKLDGLLPARQGADRQIRKIQCRLFVVLKREQHLEQRAVAQAPFWLNPFHNHVEGHVLVRVRVQRLPHGIAQHVGEALVTVKLVPEDQGVDEETDERLKLAVGPTGDRRSDDDIVLVAPACKEQRECAFQQHEERCAVVACELVQLLPQRRIKVLPDDAAFKVLFCRARPFQWQPVDGWCGSKLLLPIVQLCRHHLIPERLTLPQGEVGILDAEGRQRVVALLMEGLVKNDELPRQHSH
ncbi:hypothetical protein D3C71_810840 [compost metagenome]